MALRLRIQLEPVAAFGEVVPEEPEETKTGGNAARQSRGFFVLDPSGEDRTKIVVLELYLPQRRDLLRTVDHGFQLLSQAQ